MTTWADDRDRIHKLVGERDELRAENERLREAQLTAEDLRIIKHLLFAAGYGQSSPIRIRVDKLRALRVDDNSAR